MHSTSHQLEPAGQEVDQRKGRGGNRQADAGGRPVPALIAARLSVGDEHDRKDWAEYCGHDFYEFGNQLHRQPRFHFSVRKSDSNRAFAEALGDNVAIYTLFVTIIVLGIAGLFGVHALVEHDRRAAIEARV